MIYTNTRLKRANVHWGELAKLNDACAKWGDKYEKLNIGNEKFGVEVDALNMPAVPRHYFCLCI